MKDILKNMIEEEDEYERGYRQGNKDSVAFEDGYNEGYEQGLEEAARVPEYWVIHQEDGGKLQLGDLVYYKGWNNHYERLPIVGLGVNVAYLLWGDGDVIGYDPKDLTKA